MGHYADFEVSFDYEDEDDELKLLEWLDTLANDEDDVKDDEVYDVYFAIKNGLKDECHGGRKWYECKEDMLKVSKMFPRTLFTVHVNSEFGEYRYYFKRGKHQYVEAKFPDFDESKLE